MHLPDVTQLVTAVAGLVTAVALLLNAINAGRPPGRRPPRNKTD
jgi:hypothetical protein